MSTSISFSPSFKTTSQNVKLYPTGRFWLLAQCKVPWTQNQDQRHLVCVRGRYPFGRGNVWWSCTHARGVLPHQRKVVQDVIVLVKSLICDPDVLGCSVFRRRCMVLCIPRRDIVRVVVTLIRDWKRGHGRSTAPQLCRSGCFRDVYWSRLVMRENSGIKVGNCRLSMDPACLFACRKWIKWVLRVQSI